jgi:membrane dipeptidase
VYPAHDPFNDLHLAAASALALVTALAFATAAWATETAASARKIHEGLLTLDTHLDTPANFGRPGWDILDRHDATKDGSQIDYPRMVEGGLDGGFFAIFTRAGPAHARGHPRRP